MTVKAMDRLDRQFTYRLHLLSKASDVQSNRLYKERCGLSLPEARSLTAIGSFEPLSINDLADFANLNKGQASRAAQAMVDSGYVRKTVHPEDARGVLLTLTAQGRRKFEQVMQLILERNRDIFSCLSETEREAFSRILDKVIQHIQ